MYFGILHAHGTLVQLLAYNYPNGMPGTNQKIGSGDDTTTILQKLNKLGFKMSNCAKHEQFRNACARSDFVVMRYLARGIPGSIHTSMWASQGKTPVIQTGSVYAVLNGQIEASRCLLDAEADPNAECTRRTRTLTIWNLFNFCSAMGPVRILK